MLGIKNVPVRKIGSEEKQLVKVKSNTYLTFLKEIIGLCLQRSDIQQAMAISR